MFLLAIHYSHCCFSFWKEVRPGIGGDIPSKASVTFHYSAYLQFIDEPFDSSFLRNKPEKKVVDSGNMLPGLNIAIKTMRKNETARFLVKSQYAFGEVRMYASFLIR